MMDDVECPRCKTTKYRNPNLKLMVNVCGHALCEDCVELLFIKGSAACPQCNIPLRRNNFRLQIFEDSSVEKELDIRRKILKDFNKKEEDFHSLLEYNDYLEEVETIIFNLANNLDVEATKRKIDQYKKENKAQIMKNKGKRSKEEEELDELLELEKYETETRKQQVAEEEIKIEKYRQKKKEALIDDLMFSDLPAKDIIASHTAENEEPKHKIKRREKTTFSMGPKNQKQVFLPVPKQNNENLYVYSPLKIESCGPKLFTPNTFKTAGFLRHVRNTIESEKAGGFVPDYACYRALDDAFNGIYFDPESH